jgi:DNA adenine methylase
MKPLLRWAGGKQNLVNYLINFIPKKYSIYFEPFLGGGSLYFNICPEKAILSDQNEHLINCYKMISKDPMKIYNLLSTYIKNNSRNYYYIVRNDFNKKINEISFDQAARFIYLNRTCYNGIFRVNKNGFFNVPFGKEKPNFLNLNELILLSKQLRKSKLYSFSYENIVSKAKRGDFVYLDPPYPPLNGTSYFTHYTKERFLEEDQKKLFIFAEFLRKKGCYVLISNADTNIIRNFYSDWYINEINVTRFITCKSRRYKVKELFITNYYF